MSTSYIQSDLVVTGFFNPQGGITVPSNSITNASIQADAGIEASKLEHQYQKELANPSATTVTSLQQVVHVVFGATATLQSYQCGLVVANTTGATVDFDLLVNGTSALASTVNLGVTSPYALTDGSITSASLVAGDVVEIKWTAAAGGGTLGKGAFAEVVITEDAL